MNNKKASTLKSWLELSKLKIMIPVSLTGFTGYFLYKPQLTIESLYVTAGILFLSIFASSLNQLQEVKFDGLMKRTRNRPLPSGRISHSAAIIFSLFSLALGVFFILLSDGILPLILSILTITWYNGIYTYLKRITAYAVIPGALTGALPPLIGWVAAGGPFPDNTILIVQALFFIGQIPHFWLFILKYGGEYEAAGFPSLTKIMNRGRIARMIFYWIIICACTALSLYFFEILQNFTLTIILIAASIGLVAGFVRLTMKNGDQSNTGRYSLLLDSYFLLVMLLLISDRIIR